MLSVDPVPFDRVVDMTSVSIKPNIVVWNIRYLVTIIYKPLKRVVIVLICDDRQSRILPRTKLSRFIPTPHWTISVETILLIVHWVALGECRYDIYGVQQNQYVSYRTFAFIVTFTSSNHHHNYHLSSTRPHYWYDMLAIGTMKVAMFLFTTQ